MAKEIIELLDSISAALGSVLAFDANGHTRSNGSYRVMIANAKHATKKLIAFQNALRNPKVWTSQDGKQIAIKDLEDCHLKNILRMLKRQDINRLEMQGELTWQFDKDFVCTNGDIWIEEFEDYELIRVKNLIKEAKKRKLKWDYGIGDYA